VTGPGGLAYDRYPVAGSEEWVMRIGSADAPAIIVLPPLLEEMNRTRALLATMMRALAGFGYGCWLPDLPGTGESGRRLDACDWEDWTAALASLADQVRSASGRPPVVASLRGGCLLDDRAEARCHWRFAPAEGASLARDLLRSSLIAPAQQEGEIVELAGYPLRRSLLERLKATSVPPVSPLRTVRLATDRGDADLKIEGPALWRRSEPANAPNLAATLAEDIRAWIVRCDAS